jgi:peptide/nickel transport system substrate-binding protein
MPSSTHIIRPYHLRTILAAGIVAALALAPAARTGATSRMAGKAAGPSGSLSVVIEYEQGSLDPDVDYDAGITYIRQVYDTLVSAQGSRQVKIVPNLATSWRESPDGKTWTFHLRPHITFHDGSLVDAKAVKFSFDRMLAGKQGGYSDYVEIQGVEVVNPLTVRFHLQYPYSSFLPSLTNGDGASILNPKVASGHPVPASGPSYLDRHDAGSGPYELVTWQRRQKIVLKAYPGYWRGWSGHHVETVNIEWPASSSTQRLELEQGGLDATMHMTNQDFTAVAHEPGIVVHEYTAQTIRDILFNTSKGPLHNTLVRQALSYAFDYDGVIQGVYQGHATRMKGIGPTGFENFVPAPHLYTFDLNKAKALLKQAGYAGKKVRFTIAYLPDDTQGIQIAQIWQSDLAKIGVTAKLQGIPIATYGNVIQKPSSDPDAWIGTWSQDYNDDSQQYWTYFYSKNVPPIGYNVFYYKDPAIDTMLSRARGARDTSIAYGLYKAVCDKVYDLALEIPVAQPTERVALRSIVHGYQYNYMSGRNYYPLYDMYKS